MKYILFVFMAFLFCVCISLLITRSLKKRFHFKVLGQAILTVIISMALMTAASFGYLSIYYHADEKVDLFLTSHDNVIVSKVKNGYYFDGEGKDSALIFYPGAKVEAIAYAPLLFELAEAGIDCFLIEMPFQMAVFNMNAADDEIKQYHYKHWYIGGHSLGGTIAASYAVNHSDQIDGVVFLASYPTKKIENMSLLSIYGSNDGCLDTKSYQKNQELWPDRYTEVIIEGGNHAQYGNYGKQSGDGKSSISSSKQQTITIDAIVKFIRENGKENTK